MNKYTNIITQLFKLIKIEKFVTIIFNLDVSCVQIDATINDLHLGYYMTNTNNFIHIYSRNSSPSNFSNSSSILLIKNNKYIYTCKDYIKTLKKNINNIYYCYKIKKIYISKINKINKKKIYTKYYPTELKIKNFYNKNNNKYRREIIYYKTLVNVCNFFNINKNYKIYIFYNTYYYIDYKYSLKNIIKLMYTYYKKINYLII